MAGRLGRITRDADFRAIMRTGRPIRGRFLTIRVRPGDEPARYGIITSGRVSKLAVRRNRVRRRLREALRELAPLRTGDVVVIAAPAATDAAYAELKDDLATAFAKVK